MDGIGKSEATTLQKIAKFKCELTLEIDRLYNELLTNVHESKKERLTKKAKSDISVIEIQRKVIVDISEQFEFLTKHESESQPLMGYGDHTRNI